MTGLEEILNGSNSFWRRKGPRNDIVLSSRVRLGRNVKNIHFPDSMSDGEMEYLFALADKYSSLEPSENRSLRISSLDLHYKRLLREKNIITSEMEGSEKSLVVSNKSKGFNLLLNDVDHFRIQVIKSGFQVHEAFIEADAVDDLLNSIVPYAFSERYGYLSSNPANIGTGLKVSTLIHLPVLTMQKRISETVSPVKESGFQITGTLGNSGRIIGALYVVSNRKQFGLTEVDLVETADDIVSRIIKLEDDSRDEFFSSSRHELEDTVWRSLGILLYARRLNYVEAVEHLSRVRLGVVMSVIKDYDLVHINDLMVKIQWSHLQEYYGIRFRSIIDSDEFRAKMIRTELKNSGELDV